MHTQDGPAMFTYAERVGEIKRNFPGTLIWLDYYRKFRLQKSVDRNLQKIELQILWPMTGSQQKELSETPSTMFESNKSFDQLLHEYSRDESSEESS